MSIPFDQQLAKLRILERRAKKEADRAKSEYEKRTQELWKPVHEASERYARCSIIYMQRARELGYCGACEKPLSECCCIFLASTG